MIVQARDEGSRAKLMPSKTRPGRTVQVSTASMTGSQRCPGGVDVMTSIENQMGESIMEKPTGAEFMSA